MSLTISNDSHGMLRALYATDQRMQRSFARLATGKRIASAADDAAGLAISQRLSAQERGFHQGVRNLADGYGYAATAEGTLGSSADTLGRMRELAVQAQNGTLSAADRATIQEEYDQLAATLDQTAPAAESKTFTDGNGGEVTLDVADASASGLGVSGLDLSDPTSIDAIDQAIDDVSSARSSLGTAMNRMEYRSEAVSGQAESAAAARSRIEDADFAQEVANLTRDRILQQLQVSGLQMAGRNKGVALDLFA